MKVNEFVVKETPSFSFRAKKWKCKAPADLNAIEIIRDVKNDDGEIIFTTTTQYFLTDEEVANFARNLLND